MFTNYESYLWAVKTLQDTSATKLTQQLAKRVITSYLGSHVNFKEYVEV